MAAVRVTAEDDNCSALDEILYLALAIAHGGESTVADCLQVGQPKDALVGITQGPGARVAPGPDLTGGQDTE